MTKYQTILVSGGNKIILDFTSERKTRAALVKAMFACRDVVLANVPEADLEIETIYKNGALVLGSSMIYFQA